MKKYMLSISVIALYLIFSVYERYTLSTSQTAKSSNQTGYNPKDSFPSTIPTIQQKGKYTDGTYQGDITDAYYGNVQVQAVISQGNITQVRFLTYPNDRPRSIRINQVAMPILQSEAIQSQNSNVDIVSGATDTSQAFITSLESALSKAKR